MSPTSPVFDLRNPALKTNPFPVLAQMRAAGPIVRARMPVIGSVWLATTYDAVNDLLRDHHNFVQNPATAGNRWMAGLFRWLPRALRPLATNMLLRDPPDHRRLRSLVDQAFQRQSVEALRPRMEAITDDALRQLTTAHERSPGGVDLLAHFARPIPLAVICELLGLPPEDRPKFTEWASGISTASSAWGLFWAMRGLGKLMNYIAEEIRRQTKHPREGLLTHLIQAEEAGDKLSEDELVAMVFLLLAAGHETTLHQIASSVLALLDHPAQLRQLQQDWKLADNATQELLRYISFAQLSKPRYVKENLEFHGQSFRRGELLLACLAAANSDPAVFEHPDQLDIHRAAQRHVAFGTGIHICLGAKLARAEIAIALQRLFGQIPDIRLAVPRDQVQYVRRPGTRGLVSLPVTW
jgi:cytochrome P450